ncbi:hypothetical protein NEPAR04_0735 [Nematocida parisii]|nr:hypothetical protein NEPAR08_0736 [Nematocida parisii]KAI5127611.1 hypothetical protein NEPAR03_1001 [Nematocida parisii]KAI5141164.1 hypothetical protein NEPAR04_0735 [Nematocida parisii]
MKERYALNSNNRIITKGVLCKNRIIVLLTIYICSVCARLSFEQAQEVQKIKLEDNLVIHPHGGLAPVYQYLIEKSEYLKNLRGYFHGIKSNKIEDGSYGGAIHEYIDDYIKEVALLLINMFPSEDSYLSIESETSDSLAFFLRNYKESSHSLYILASLFLLAEGVNIPIEIKEQTANSGNKTLVLKKKGTENVFHVNLSMSIKESPKEGIVANLVYQHKTEYIVNFFKRLTTAVPSSRLEVPEEFSMPNTYEEFLTGNFLNNPKFLIQSYFFEYIDTVEMYEKFVRAVYELLSEHLSSKTNENPCIETEKSIKKIFDSLFIDAELNEKLKNTQYIKDLRSVECELKKEMLPTPYIDNINMLANRDIPEYNRKSNEFYKTTTKISKCCLPRNQLTYSNETELALLCIFSFFAFDPETMKYDISHLPNPSKELKRFFSKYSAPLLPMDYTMYKEWSRVVEDLPCKDISYELNSRNRIAFTLFNILYVIREVAGSTEKINEAIDLNNKYINYKEIKKVVGMHLEDAFKSLSRNKNVSAACKFNYSLKNDSNQISTTNVLSFCAIYKKTRTSNSPVVKIRVTNKFKGDSNAFKCKDVKNKLNNYNSSAKEELQTLQKKYTNPASHIEYVMKCYADIYLDKLSFLSYRQYTFINRIKSALDSKYTCPNRLLLCGDLENLYYKSKIIEMFLIHSETKIQYKNNPMVLFIGNLIISIPIHDKWIKSTGIFKYIYTEECKQYYPFMDNVETVKDNLKSILLAALNRISQ